MSLANLGPALPGSFHYPCDCFQTDVKSPGAAALGFASGVHGIMDNPSNADDSQQDSSAHGDRSVPNSGELDLPAFAGAQPPSDIDSTDEIPLDDAEDPWTSADMFDDDALPANSEE